MRNPLSLILLAYLLRLALGLFFLYTGISKLWQIQQTAQTLTQADILPLSFSLPLAYIGIAMEIIVGFCFTFRWAYKAASIWAVVMTACFLGIFVQSWIRDIELYCNCFAMNTQVNSYPLEVGLRLLLFGATISLLWDAFRPSSKKKFRRPLDFSDI